MKNPINILLIEDSEHDRELIRTQLELAAHDFSVREVSTLTAGVDEMRREEPDAVLLDLALPDALSLDDALLKIKAVRTLAAIVVVSGRMTPERSQSLILGTASATVDKTHLELLEREILVAIANQRTTSTIDKAIARTEARIKSDTEFLKRSEVKP
jgi:DNA-binding NarL/FixJ family response regulator